LNKKNKVKFLKESQTKQGRRHFRK